MRPASQDGVPLKVRPCARTYGVPEPMPHRPVSDLTQVWRCSDKLSRALVYWNVERRLHEPYATRRKHATLLASRPRIVHTRFATAEVAREITGEFRLQPEPASRRNGATYGTAASSNSRTTHHAKMTPTNTIRIFATHPWPMRFGTPEGYTSRRTSRKRVLARRASDRPLVFGSLVKGICTC